MKEEEKSENPNTRKPENQKLKNKKINVKKSEQKNYYFFVSTTMISFERTTRLSEKKKVSRGV